MIIRYLPLILIVAALVLALAPIEAAAQQELGPGVPTQMTPVDRETQNGVFDRIKKKLGFGTQKPTVVIGDVKPVVRLTAEDVAAGYVVQATPYTTDPPPANPPKAPPPASPDSQPRPKAGGAPASGP